MTTIVTKFFKGWKSHNQVIIDTVRNIVKNNGLSFVDLSVITDSAFLPTALVELGVFRSNNDMRKKRPDLFKDVEYGERVKVGKINLFFYPLDMEVSHID